MTDREIGSSRDREKLSEAAALIASLIAERDKLKEERDTIWALRGEMVAQRGALVERVSVLETALEQIMDPNGTDWQSEIARAALRTSEDAK
jgi:uncharacterized coiled-coil DUF342 family protein